jgi:hypothetical protein
MESLDFLIKDRRDKAAVNNDPLSKPQSKPRSTEEALDAIQRLTKMEETRPPSNEKPVPRTHIALLLPANEHTTKESSTFLSHNSSSACSIQHKNGLGRCSKRRRRRRRSSNGVNV